MSSIGTDLAGLLESVRAERAQLEKRLRSLVEREQMLAAWLKEEAGMLGFGAEEKPAIEAAPLSAYLYSVLQDGSARTLEHLTNLAVENKLANGDTPGRQVHFALVGLTRRGLVQRNPDRMWMVKSERPSVGTARPF